MCSAQNVTDLADRVEKQIEYHRRTLSPKTDPLAVIGGFLAFVGVLAAVPLDFFLAVVTLGFPIICVFLIGFFGMNLVERFMEIVEDVDHKNRLLPDGKNGCFSFVYYSLASERTFKLFQPHYLSISIYIWTFFLASIFFIVWVMRLTPISSQILLTYIVLATLPLLFALAIQAESRSIKHIKFDHELRLNSPKGKWTRIELIDKILSQLLYNLDIVDRIRSIEPKISRILSLSLILVLFLLIWYGFFLSFVIEYKVAGQSIGINTIFTSMIQDVSRNAEAQIQLIDSSKNYLAMLFFMVVYYVLLIYFAFNSAAHKLSYSCYWILNSIKKEIDKCIRTNTSITPNHYRKWYGEYLISSLYDNLAVDFFGIFSFPKLIFSMTNTEIEENSMLLTEYIHGKKDEIFFLLI